MEKQNHRILWNLVDGRMIYLLHLDDFMKIPNGTPLINIHGELSNKTNESDTDTRMGYVAYGLECEIEPKETK